MVEAGLALTAPAALKAAVSTLCFVHRRNPGKPKQNPYSKTNMNRHPTLNPKPNRRSFHSLSPPYDFVGRRRSCGHSKATENYKDE